jgi:DNA-binding MarR family transcriptional regulator
MSRERSFIKNMNNEEQKNITRSLSDKNWYWVSKSVLNRYGRILGGSGLAVYNVLASYANSKSQTCFPTQKTIADRIGLSRRSVNRKVRMLKKLNLVRVKRLQGRCVYFLLKPDAPNGIQQIRQKRYKGYATSGVYNNNKEIKINNKNNGTDGFNNLKSIRQLLKMYEQKTFKNHRH